jgi:hypothetical protein
MFADHDADCHTIPPEPLLWLASAVESMMNDMDDMPLSQRVQMLTLAAPKARLVRVTPTQGCDVWIGGYKCVNKVLLEPTKWCNPFQYRGNSGLQGVAVARYREWIMQPEQAHLIAALGELKEKVLGCTCLGWMDAPCHGEVLIELVNSLTT